jgi:hypothetical protein
LVEGQVDKEPQLQPQDEVLEDQTIESNATRTKVRRRDEVKKKRSNLYAQSTYSCHVPLHGFRALSQGEHRRIAVWVVDEEPEKENGHKGSEWIPAQ